MHYPVLTTKSACLCVCVCSHLSFISQFSDEFVFWWARALVRSTHLGRGRCANSFHWTISAGMLWVLRVLDPAGELGTCRYIECLQFCASCL